MLKTLSARLERLESSFGDAAAARRPMRTTGTGVEGRGKRIVCYKCGQVGHIARNCTAAEGNRSKWPVPTLGRDVQQFLGLVGYYRNYIQSFATIAKPLYQLTERGREFDWSKECSISFQELRSRLVAAPILAFPDFSKPFLLDTDACETGIGAVLSQEHDGLERVVAYASRTLSKAERKYCVTMQERIIGSGYLYETFQALPVRPPFYTSNRSQLSTVDLQHEGA